MQRAIPSSRLWGDAVVCVLTALSLAPTCAKAFHIDDPFYIRVAQHIAQNPLDYYGLTLNWYGRSMDVYDMHASPPLVPYVLAVWGTLFGWTEVSLHLCYLAYALLLMASTYRIASRFCGQPMLAGMVTLWSPVVMVTSTNVMLDLPMAAFFVAALALWCEGIETERYGLLVLAGVAAGLSALSKYFGLAFVPLAFVYAVFCKRRMGIWILPLAVPLLCFGIEQASCYALYGRSIFVNAIDIAGENKSGIAFRLSSALSFTGGCMIGLLAFSYHMRPRHYRVLMLFVLLVLAVLATAVLVFATREEGLPAASIAQAALFVVGGGILFALVVDEWRTEQSPASVLLTCWVMGTFLFASVLNWSVTARTLLPMAPAVAILIVRRIERAYSDFGRIPPSIWAPVAGCAALSIAVAWADYAWAGSIRSVANLYATEAQKRPGAAYFQGHWGWQYYLEEAGWRIVDWNDFAYKPGDYVVMPQNNANVDPIPARVAQEVATTLYPTTRWLTVSCRALGAGFYSDTFGPLPFAFGKVPPDPYHAVLLGSPKGGSTRADGVAGDAATDTTLR